MAARKLHGSQRIVFLRALHDDARSPFRGSIPVEDSPRAFIRRIGREDQAAFKSSAQSVDCVATEIALVGALNPLTGRDTPDHSRSGDRLFDEVASRVTAHGVSEFIMHEASSSARGEKPGRLAMGASGHGPEEVGGFALRKLRPRISGRSDWTKLA
jgi:hypothetical protein